ncbi:hypothetical protein A3K29_00300 [Candidatus Collierbacteria bacterium RIFOXYB2_FULL_46_14]|uniref:Beta-lactamase class A-like protein n=1 Tax=Candidatus Collierbacteria bacterium GW2011_GWA2_46_26 TaxID=1618381 RepID=A0A0G1PLN3_9BACT|nr:MAG: hypothetical protein UW29_C0001G0039 [Candidatus Collierbacteria bacterium GW2011_GWC2_44_13]KKU33631.1 MAG: hypothetical protein UX47_C0002G0039 [Candidatus Collierbacteria bacterium GW2011_GWA2_46_26]OGD72579.1 MAG: hypothetical protein A3K29_00300 [Candidatus Collierbacteria bacterium RIFOXYB2_FULL_46_14]OGD75621.1 MAG: hypothetical protein A3K43_00300 [Candidatus Collierbacteria bacterium RIFOXYA2_FULL_46_20]OGD76957.1 MAG: hypothetical protein A3K39_00300 [Candidatus Collierbacteri
MDLPSIKDYLLAYFFGEFDHDLINDQSNDPYLHVSIITSSETNPHRDSFGLYLKKKDRPATHTAFTTANMAAALVLEGKYLLQKPSGAQPVDDTVGYTKGINIGKNQIIIVTVITRDPEDAKFVSKMITNKILAFVGK